MIRDLVSAGLPWRPPSQACPALLVGWGGVASTIAPAWAGSCTGCVNPCASTRPFCSSAPGQLRTPPPHPPAHQHNLWGAGGR